MTATKPTGSMSLDEIDIHSTAEYRRRGYPWEAWDLLRAEAPVYWYERPGIEPFWALTRYHDIQWVSANDKLFVNGGGRLRLASIDEDKGMWDRWAKRVNDQGWDADEPMDMVFMDRPRHTKFRGLTARRFTPRAIRDHDADLDRYAARFTAELEEKLERDGEADLVMDFAIKLPLATICDLLGVPADDWLKVFRFTEIMSDDEIAAVRPGANVNELRLRSSARFQEYLAALVEGCRAAPRDDLANAVVGGQIDGCPLTPQQLTGYLILLLGAGNETTRNATTRGVTALLRAPGAVAAPGRRPVSHGAGGRGDPTVDLARDPVRPNRHRRRRPVRPDDPGGRYRRVVLPVRQPG